MTNCVSDYLKMLRESGLFDRPEMRDAVDRLEKLARSRSISDARRKVLALQEHKKTMRHQISITVAKELSGMKLEALSDILTPLARENPKEATRLLEDLLQFGVGFGRVARRDGQQSLVGIQRSIQLELMGKLRPIVDRYTNIVTMRASKDSEMLRFAMEGGTQGVPAHIAKDAQFIRDTLAPYLDMARESGVMVASLDAWSPGRPMAGRVARDKDAFITFLKANLDRTMHPDVEDSAESIYRSIVSGAPAQGRTLSLSREVHFSTPEARVEYMRRFGEPDTAKALSSYVTQLSSTIGQARMFGPDSRATFEQLTKNVLDTANRVDPRLRLRPDRLMELFDIAAGTVEDALNPTGASVMASARNFASATLLGGVALAVVGQDSLMVPLRMARSVGWGRAFKDTLSGYRSMFNSQTRQYLKEELGIMEHVTHLLSRDARYVFDGGVTPAENLTQAYGAAMMRVNGTEFLEQVQRGVAGLSVSRGLVRELRHSAWEAIDPDYRTMLQNNGIGKQAWNRLRGSLDDLVEPHTQGMMPNNIDDADLRLLVRSFFHREVENMVLRPDIYTRHMLSGGRRGTIRGELMPTASQFLSWPTQFARSTISRQVSLGVPGAIATGTGLFVGGVVTEQLYAVARGQPGYDWDNPNLYWRGLVRSGLLTPPGELVLGTIAGDWRASLTLGPAADLIAGAFGRTGALGQAAIMDGDAYAAAWEATRLARTFLPNTWWLEGAIIEPAFQALGWELDPEYMRRRERQWERERKSE